MIHDKIGASHCHPSWVMVSLALRKTTT